MSDIRLNDVNMLYLIWAIPVFVGLFAYAAHRRKRALERFADTDLLKLLNVSIHTARRRWKTVLVLSAMAFIVIGLARPAWNPAPKEIERRGRDVVFVMDVSKSMLATDLAPNRLERAKIAVKDCLNRLEGDRVALVAFAGTAVVKCPLTLDYGFFRLMLDDISAGSISRGGTLIGDAIRKTLDEVFSDQEKRFKDVILIADGEDHDSFPVQAAEEAGKRGVRIIAIGLGDENEGTRIPVEEESGRKTFLKYKDREIWSKLDADTLRKMVNQTPGGRYLNVATGTIDLGEVYTKLVASAEKKSLEAMTVKRFEEKFQIFLGIALALLCLDIVLGERKRRIH